MFVYWTVTWVTNYSAAAAEEEEEEELSVVFVFDYLFIYLL